MRWVYIILMGMMLGSLGSCSSARVYSDKVQGVDLSRFKTYAWLPSPKDTTDGNKNALSSDIADQNIRAAVDREMQSRGYRLDPTNPDLLVLQHTNFQNRQETVRSPIYSSYNYYYPGFYAGPWYPYYYSGYSSMPYITGYDIRQIEYTEGKVVIDVIDRDKHQLVWRGWSTEEIDTQKDVNKLYKHVEDIFDKYPVKAKKQQR